MGLAETWTSEEEERVECSLARSSRNTLTCCESHLVALSYHKVLEAINRVELWIYLYSLDAGKYKWSRVTSSGECLYRHGLVYRDISMRCRIDK